jgi:hypothetical protein
MLSFWEKQSELFESFLQLGCWSFVLLANGLVVGAAFFEGWVTRRLKVAVRAASIANSNHKSNNSSSNNNSSSSSSSVGGNNRRRARGDEFDDIADDDDDDDQGDYDDHDDGVSDSGGGAPRERKETKWEDVELDQSSFEHTATDGGGPAADDGGGGGGGGGRGGGGGGNDAVAVDVEMQEVQHSQHDRSVDAASEVGLVMSDDDNDNHDGGGGRGGGVASFSIEDVAAFRNIYYAAYPIMVRRTCV